MPEISSREAMVFAAVTAGAWSLYQLLDNRSWLRRRFEAPWVRVGSVGKLYIYPLKSSRGMEVEEGVAKALCFAAGEARDRQFLLVEANEEHTFVTGRTQPRLVLVRAAVKDGQLVLNAPDMPTCVVDIASCVRDGEVVDTALWRQRRIQGLDCGDEVARWFGQFLNAGPFRLLHFTPHANLFNERHVNLDPKYFPLRLQRNDLVSFPDASAFNILSSSSVDDLNLRAKDKGAQFCARNFRPTILVDGSTAYDENNWEEMRIGGAVLRFLRHCNRCSMTTVEPETGVMRKDYEPVRTLQSYRSALPGSLKEAFKTNPLLGVQLVVDKVGKLAVGDDVFVRYRRKPDNFGDLNGNPMS